MEIGLIGAGPRGLVVAERLIERQREQHKFEQLMITLIDPFGIGGRVWQPNQSPDLIMNTNPSQISMFTDETNEIKGPIVPGPNLYEWIKTAGEAYIKENHFSMSQSLLAEISPLTENGYATRGMFGVYLNWFYAYLQSRITADTTLKIITEEVVAVQPSADTNQYLIKCSNHILPVDKVVMALGHSENKPTAEQAVLRQFAVKQHINYIYPMQPQEYAFQELAAGQTIVIRGLGLSFFDAMAMLTIGRGGTFTRDDKGDLVYQPSGKEPVIVAGSRLGVPLRAKGRNEKNVGERTQPHFFTAEWFAAAKAQGKISGREFIQTVHLEVEYVYYERLIEQSYPTINVDSFLDEFRKSADPEMVVQQSDIAESDYFDWDRTVHPMIKIGGITDYLKRDADEANKGTKTGPLTSAFEVFRDIRDVFRKVVNLQLLDPDDYRDDFLGQFNYENSHLAVGPPENRIEELRALVIAGVVKILGPNMAVETDDETGSFVTWSKAQPERKVHSTYLLEGRLPSIKADQSQNFLLQQLVGDQLAQAHELRLSDGTKFKTGAIDVDVQTQQLLVNGKRNPQLFFWGVPTEGKQWFTTASPRPLTNDVTFRQGDAIAEQLTQNSI